MENEKIKSGVTILSGVPTMIGSILIALKFAGLTDVSYWSIILFSFEVWAIIVGVVVGVWVLFMFIGAILASIKW